MAVYYEWSIETADEHGDITDSDFRDTLLEFSHCFPLEIGQSLVLVRNVGCESEGVQDREWAYAIQRDGRWVLPEQFDGGTKVPKRFQEELYRYQA